MNRAFFKACPLPPTPATGVSTTTTIPQFLPYCVRPYRNVTCLALSVSGHVMTDNRDMCAM